jgi:serine protease
MKRYLSLALLTALMLTVFAGSAHALKPRMRFEKYLWAEGVNPKARYLDQLMVKFFDEDQVRLRDGQLVSLNATTALSYTHDFLARHPEIRVDVIIRSETEEEHEKRISDLEQRSGKDLVDMFSFYCFHLPGPAADPKGLLADILRAPEVETAYYEPIPYDATCTDLGNVTPNYVPQQDYHDAAPTGVDLGYAQTTFGADVVDGAGTGVWVGLFERGIQTTHEDVTLAVVATAGTPDADNDHGTSVMGILGACDDNNVGCLGFLADEEMRLYQRNSGSYPSVADIYNLANTQLAAGEVTNSSWAYFADPMPPGQTCPCNPGQNGHVPIEYNAAVKAEIDAGTADGIHYFLAAGNGCTDLDWAGFGAAFDWTTGSVYVGAVESALPHDAACFTDYGSRISSCAWGENIVSTGYGDLFAGTGRNEYYTDTFGGTSGASPTVAGCAGVLNNIYRNINSGANISTTTMRSWLTVGATQPGATPGNIGSMPNLFGITSPNLNPDFRAGWSNYVVPRNTTGATGSDCLLPATLNSDPDTTWWNSAIENTSNFGTADPAHWTLFRDGVWMVGWAFEYLLPLGRGYETNWGGNHAVTRGGRHTVRLMCDYYEEVVEFFENDNSWAGQFVWNPRGLAAETQLQFTRPPTKTVPDQPGSYYNCDGYYFASGYSGWWDLMGVMARSTTADYDMRIYSESYSSTNGFDDYEAWSSYGGSPVDIVGRNQHEGVGTAYTSVINWNDGSADYIIDGETSTSAGTPGYGRILAGTFTITANEIMDAMEFVADATVPYEIEAEMTSGDANIAISLFGWDDDYFSLPQRNAYANSNGAGQSEYLCFTPDYADSSWLVVVHKYSALDTGQTATFNLYIGKARFDLTHYLVTGWSHKIVVRQVSGSSPAVLPATLTGNVSTNYLNAGYKNIGCVTSPANLNDAYVLDGPTVYTSGGWAAVPAGVVTYGLNNGPTFVFGGRHEVGDIIDVNNEGTEWREDNNRHDEQFVWTPVEMENGVIVHTSVTAPNFRDANSSVVFAAANQHGFHLTGSNHWVGVGMIPSDIDDDYNLHLFPPSTGSEDGFATRLVPSWVTGGGLVEFVVENGNLHGAASYDVGVCNNWSYPGTLSEGDFRVVQCNSRADLPLGFNGPYFLNDYRPIDVYDVQLTAGVPETILLDNRGDMDLGLAIYSPLEEYGSRSNNGTIVNSYGNGGDETISYTPAATGRHGLVVFKNDQTDAASCQYALIIGGRTPATPQRFVARWDSTTATYQWLNLHWDSVLVDIYGNAFQVDNYLLRWSQNMNDTYSPAWSTLVLPSSNSIEIGFPVAWLWCQMVIVARDRDGYLVAEMPPGGGWVRSDRNERVPLETVPREAEWPRSPDGIPILRLP